MIMKLSLFIGTLSFIGIWEIRIFFKKEQKKEIFTYIAILSSASFLYILFLNNIDVPNLLNGITFIFEPIGKWLDKMLGG